MNEYLKQNKENKGNKDGHASQTSYCITFFDRMHQRFNPLVAQVGEASPLSTYVTGIDPWVYWAGARVKKDAEKTSSHKPIQHSFSILIGETHLLSIQSLHTHIPTDIDPNLTLTILLSPFI